MSEVMYVIKIDEYHWKASYSGVGQVTPFLKNARVYSTMTGAKIGLAKIRKYKTFPNAVIIALDQAKEQDK